MRDEIEPKEGVQVPLNHASRSPVSHFRRTACTAVVARSLEADRACLRQVHGKYLTSMP